MRGGGQSSLKLLARIIGVLAGVTSGSTRRAGSLRDTAHYPKFGFRLAEVLITLGIIGIVAAMTLPTLVGKYQEKVTITRLKKAYSILSQAYISVTNDYGYPDEWEIVQSDDDTPVQTVTYYNVLKKYIKRLRICNATDCRPVYKFLNGNQDGNSSYRAASFPMILPDGTYIKVSPLEDKDTMDCSYNRGNTNALKSVCNSIYVDINGSQKPNTYGRGGICLYFIGQKRVWFLWVLRKKIHT